MRYHCSTPKGCTHQHIGRQAKAVPSVGGTHRFGYFRSSHVLYGILPKDWPSVKASLTFLERAITTKVIWLSGFTFTVYRQLFVTVTDGFSTPLTEYDRTSL